MSLVPLDPTVRELAGCGCCEGIGTVTPVGIANRPGLPAIAYRVGTHGAFKRSLLAGLSDARRPVLAALRTRDDDDFAIGLLDCAALVSDVLAFYQERIANECYLRTATERRSVLELARLIGYELAPGLAAQTLLAYTLDDAPGSPGSATIDTGARVQSVPAPGEHPQTFETVEALDARAEWNALLPAQRAVVWPEHGDRGLALDGVATGLRPGDALLVVGDERAADDEDGRWHLRTLATVEPDPAAGLTRVTWTAGLGQLATDHDAAPAAAHPQAHALRLRASLFGANAPDWRMLADDVRNRYLGGATDAGGNPSASDTEPDWPGLTLAGSAFGATTGADAIAGRGLLGEYFNDKDLTEPALTRVDTTLDFDWPSGTPDAAIEAGTFSARWTGKVVAPTTEAYTFTTRSDDGVRLWVAGSLLIDNWTDHPPTDDTGTIELQAGVETAIRIEFFQGAGPATMKLSWSSATTAQAIVPAAGLRVPDIVELGTTHPEIAAGGWAALAGPAGVELFRVAEAAESSREGFGLAGKTTRLQLQGPRLSRFSRQVRETAVLAADEALAFAREPIRTPVEGAVLDLAALVTPLPPGRTVIVSGRRARVRAQAGAVADFAPGDGGAARPLGEGEELVLLARPASAANMWRVLDGGGVGGTIVAGGGLELLPSAPGDPVVAEHATVASAETVEASFTRLTLEAPLAGVYDRATVTIAGNVVAATHGETVGETLGGADAAQAFQRFGLRDKPLTYVGAPTAAGRSSTLAVRVNDLLWHEVPALYGHGPRERVFATHREDDGTTVLRFGDGVTGSRPPTGRQNVTAAYRKGTGLEGEVAAGQLSLLMTRPLGVRSVVNPLEATGAEDPQGLDDARDNAPVTVLTMDRIVSLRDYEDFARGFAGIAKAAAVWTWHTDRRGVLLTVAGPRGEAVAPGDEVALRLAAAIAANGDDRVPVVIGSYRPVPFRLGAVLQLDPDALTAAVVAAVEAALRGAFSFRARAFGQPVALSEVFAVIQPVAGVVAADVHALWTGTAASRTPLLTAESPAPGADAAAAVPAQLLTLDLRPGDVQAAP